MPCFQGSEIIFHVGSASLDRRSFQRRLVAAMLTWLEATPMRAPKPAFLAIVGGSGRDEALLDRLLQVAVVAVQRIDRRERIVSEHAILGRQHRTGRLAVFENQRIVAHTQAEQHIEMGLG